MPRINKSERMRLAEERRLVQEATDRAQYADRLLKALLDSAKLDACIANFGDDLLVRMHRGSQYVLPIQYTPHGFSTLESFEADVFERSENLRAAEARRLAIESVRKKIESTLTSDELSLIKIEEQVDWADSWAASDG